MEFRKVTFAKKQAVAPKAPPPGPAPGAPTAAAPVGAGGPPSPSNRRQALIDTSQNLLKHIPGEASGFYLMAVDAFDKPSLGTLGLIFVLALVLLVAVRWLAGASRWIMATTGLAFFLWMFILDKGLLHVALPNVLPDPLGLIVGVFYSTLITILASAGVIR